jgi:hypothetical protein
LEEGSSNFIYVKLKNGEVFQVEWQLRVCKILQIGIAGG